MFTALCIVYSQICGTFPPVFMNIFSRSRLTCTIALSVLLFNDLGEFETDLSVRSGRKEKVREGGESEKKLPDMRRGKS